MKTAMQQLYNELESLKDITQSLQITDIQRMIGNLYLETEKKQIIEAFNLSQNTVLMTAEQYYSETFEK